MKCWERLGGFPACLLLRSSRKFLTRSSVPEVTHTWSEETGRVSASRVYTSFSGSMSTLSTKASTERKWLNFWHSLQVNATRPHFSFLFFKVNGPCKIFTNTFLTGISSESSVSLVADALFRFRQKGELKVGHSS